MQYRHVPDGDHTDLAPGRVLLSAPGHPAFPARLGMELFDRCLEHLPSDDEVTPDEVTLWDPCCGSGALVAMLGLARRPRLAAVIASDVDDEPLALARRNMALLTNGGLAERARDLAATYEAYGKESHRAAVGSATRLTTALDAAGGDLPHHVAQLDALDPEAVGEFLRRHSPDVVVTDVPYGRQSHWITAEGRHASAEVVVATLAAALRPHTVLAVATAGRRVSLPPGTRALERVRVGHRAAVILRAGDMVDPLR